MSSTAANFSQAADYNDYDAGGTPTNGVAESGGYHKFGQFQGENIPGDKGFRLKGIISLGTTAASVNFNSANDNIIVTDEFLTYSDFTRIEFRNASSNITIVNLTVNFTARDSRIVVGDAPATTRGNVESFDNPAVLKIDGCSFNDLGTFIFQSNADLDDTTFRRCDQVTQGGGTFTNCSFETTRADIALVSSVTTANNIVTGNFVGDGTSHAVQLGNVTSSTGITWNSTHTGYAGTSAGPSASSTSGDSETILVNVSGGQTLTISVSGIGVAPTVRNTGAGAVSIVSSKTLTINNILADTELRLYSYTDLADPNTYTELGGIESVGTVTGGDNGFTTPVLANGVYSTTLSYNTSGGDIPVLLVAHALASEFFRETLTLSSTENTSFTVFQIVDRQYNPGSV